MISGIGAVDLLTDPSARVLDARLTTDLQKRVSQRRTGSDGRSLATERCTFRPVCYERTSDIGKAIARERQIKGGPIPRPSPRHLFVPLLLAGLILLPACRKNESAARDPFTSARPLDVVLVTIDTLRYDAVGFDGNAEVATPNLDRIASEGVRFTNAHGQNVVTLPSHVNILTGLYPFQHGVRDNDGFKLDPKIPTLATFFKKAGYATGAFIGAYPLDARYGLAHDFDVYDERYPEEKGPYEFEMAERPAPEVLSAARNWWAKSAVSKRFLWVHLYDCHAPYRPPPPFDRMYADHPYWGEVAGVDRALASLFEDLRADPHPVLLVLTADHGEALGSHGELTHGLFAYEATLHVPLLLWSPGHLAPRVDSRMARHIDIAPTILEAAGLPVPANLPGVSLLDAGGKRGATSYFEALSASFNRGWAPLTGEIRAGYKYIDLPVPELYDLARDPAEEHNLASGRLDLVRAMKRELPAAAAPNRQAPSSEEAARLRSLGYLAGSEAPKTHYGPEDDPKNLIGVDNQIHQVIDLYQRQRLADAVALARRIVSERPTMTIGYEFLSFLQGQEGDDAAAIDTLEKARRRQLLDEALTVRLALLDSEAGRNHDALTLLAPFSGSQDPDTWNAIGVVRATAGNMDSAIAAFHHALTLDPKNAVAWQNIGITDVQHRRLAEAVAAFDRAFALNDKLPRAWNARGVALEEMGRTDEALASWQKAVALDSTQFDALYNIGLTAARAGKRDLARQALARFVQTAPPQLFGRDLEKARKALGGLK
jgi:arylsulfatase A-like enzyme/Flp pilus assembly protein TadD